MCIFHRNLLVQYLHCNVTVPADGEAGLAIESRDQFSILIRPCISQRRKLITVWHRDQSHAFFPKLVNDLIHARRSIALPPQREICKIELNDHSLCLTLKDILHMEYGKSFLIYIYRLGAVMEFQYMSTLVRKIYCPEIFFPYVYWYRHFLLPSGIAVLLTHLLYASGASRFLMHLVFSHASWLFLMLPAPAASFSPPGAVH